LAVAKCADHLPLYRLEKDFRRQGFPIARSTMNELLHRAVGGRLYEIKCLECSTQ
jgi:transposase